MANNHAEQYHHADRLATPGKPPEEALPATSDAFDDADDRELYGPDAFMGDRFPFTESGEVRSEAPTQSDEEIEELKDRAFIQEDELQEY